MAAAEATPPESPVRSGRRYRRRLRSRIILSFVLLSFALTALFAARVPLLPGRTPADFWTGLLNPKLGRALWAAARLPDTPLDTLPDAAWQVLANTAKHWLFEDLTPCGWKQAQTTGGGLSLTELEPSFQFKGCPGLYFVGETLDCAGMCGGFNLHWAFGSGITAGRDAVRTLRRPHKKR